MRKFKFIFLVILWMIPQLTKAQTANYIIVGKVDSQFLSSYAFLYFPQRKITKHIPITNSEFKFTAEKKSKFETATLYFGIDSTKTITDVYSNGRPGTRESIIVALEDSVHISLSNDLKMAKVVGGGLNKDMKDMDETLKSGNYLNFFTTHPNSPVSLLFLRSLVRIKNNPMFSESINCELFYAKLSEELRKSPEGLVVWEMIIK